MQQTQRPASRDRSTSSQIDRNSDRSTLRPFLVVIPSEIRRILSRTDSDYANTASNMRRAGERVRQTPYLDWAAAHAAAAADTQRREGDGSAAPARGVLPLNGSSSYAFRSTNLEILMCAPVRVFVNYLKLISIKMQNTKNIYY